MRSFTCPHCQLVFLGEDSPESNCPGCDKPWPQTVVLHEPPPPTAAAAAPGLTATSEVAQPKAATRISRPLLAGLAVGALAGASLMFALRYRLVSVNEFSAYNEARQAQANAEQLSQEAETRLQELANQLAAAQSDLASVKERYTKDTSELEPLRTEFKALEQQLFQLRLATAHSFARNWLILGPFKEVDEAREQRILATPDPFRFNAEQEGVKWQRVDSPEDRINLAQAFNQRDAANGYAVCWVYADTDSDASLSLGSDDGLIVWVNRQQVHKNLTNRSASPNQDQAPCKLRTGWNEILIRVDNLGAGDWALFCEFRTPDKAAPLKLFSTGRNPSPPVANP